MWSYNWIADNVRELVYWKTVKILNRRFFNSILVCMSVCICIGIWHACKLALRTEFAFLFLSKTKKNLGLTWQSKVVKDGE